VAAIVLPYSRASIEAEVPAEQHYLFYTMFTLCLTGPARYRDHGGRVQHLRVPGGLLAVDLRADRPRSRPRALVASYQYLIMGTIGATFIVIGIGLLYLMTGTLNLADMGRRIGAVQGTRPVLAALAFITVGVSLKLALFPLHQWLPNAYAYAPSAVSAFLAATATKVAVYVLLRFYFSVFGELAGVRETAHAGGHAAAGAGRHVRGLHHRHLPDRPEAPVRLFERRPDRLHHPRAVLRLGHGPDRHHRPSVQPRGDQGRDLHVAGGGDGGGRWHEPGTGAGSWKAHAADQSSASCFAAFR
jgi:hypothetical protein